MKNLILKILKDNSKDGFSGDATCISEYDFDRIAEQIESEYSKCSLCGCNKIVISKDCKNCRSVVIIN